MRHIIFPILMIAYINANAQELSKQKNSSDEIPLKVATQNLNISKATYKKVQLLSKQDTLNIFEKIKHEKPHVKIPDSLLYCTKQDKN